MNKTFNKLEYKNKKILITSKIDHHNKNYLYLNYGCLDLKKSLSNKYILKHPWENKQQYFKDINKIKRLNLIIFKEFKQILNNYFKIKKDKRYWKIIIGPWLHCFVYIYYEKNLIINQILKKKKILVPIFKFNNMPVPQNFNNFSLNYITSNNWNNYLFSKIFLIKNKKKQNIKIIKKLNEHLLHNSKFKINILYYFKILIIKILNFILINRFKNQSFFFFQSYLSIKNNLYLFFKNFSLPLIINLKKNVILNNIELRNFLIKKNKIQNKFYRMVFEEAFLNIPTDYLENFEMIRKEIFKLNINFKPKTIFTTNGLYMSTAYSVYTAESVSNGCKLILAQHGGRYGNIKKNFHLDHELEICDHYIFWGKIINKINNNKIKSFGFIKNIKQFNLRENQLLHNKKILFLITSRPRYYRSEDSEMNLKSAFRYFQDCPKFYLKLRKNLKHELIYRLNNNKHLNWDLDELLIKKCKFASIDYCKENFLSVASKSRITVCSYFSTTFMELMVANLPVLLFTPFSYDSYNKETLNQFELLKKNQIFFDNYASAVNFINTNYEKVFEWWNHTKIQECRKKFLENFCIINPRLIKDIQLLIKK